MDAASILALLTKLIAAGAQITTAVDNYRRLIDEIRTNDPDAWEHIKDSFGESLAGFKAAGGGEG